ncbi:MAG: enoyl-CoA hydratase [Chloroflexi bacterium]|nr:enoyl-CoA hydratase [Chloroflexota bacterium]
MGWKTLIYRLDGAVAVITTNRPHVLNAQSRLMIEEITAAFDQAAADAGVRVIVVAGAGDHFSSGHDLGSQEELADREVRGRPSDLPEAYENAFRLYLDATLRWRDVPKPTIAQVQGYCIMGGLMLASACDLIVASEDAKFADRAVRWGGAHVQYASLPWEVGPRKAKEYLFTGDWITAPEALRLGLVNRVVPRERLEEETMALAGRIAVQDPFALRLAKLSVNQAADLMGQRNALVAAFQNYMLAAASRERPGGDQERTDFRQRTRRRDEPFGDHR